MVWKQEDFILGAILVCWKWGSYADPDQQGDMSGLSLSNFFGKTSKKNCQTQGMGVPGNISVFDTLESDDGCARYVQDLLSP